MQGSGLDDPMSSISFKKGLSRKQTEGQFGSLLLGPFTESSLPLPISLHTYAVAF